VCPSLQVGQQHAGSRFGHLHLRLRAGALRHEHVEFRLGVLEVGRGDQALGTQRLRSLQAFYTPKPQSAAK